MTTSAHPCDADRVIRAIQTADGFPDRPIHHSRDLVTVWHGMSTPAHACGKHAAGLGLLNVFRGHRARMGETNTVTVITTDGSYDVVIPTD